MSTRASCGERRAAATAAGLVPRCDAGDLTWEPGAGFIGTYRLVFVRTLSNGVKTKVPVRVNIAPKFDRAGQNPQ